jgi:hypothetical protein
MTARRETLSPAIDARREANGANVIRLGCDFLSGTELQANSNCLQERPSRVVRPAHGRFQKQSF